MRKASTEQMLDLLKSTELYQQKSLFHTGTSLVYFLNSMHENTLIHGFALDCYTQIISNLLLQLMIVSVASYLYPNVYQENLSHEDAAGFQSRASKIISLLSPLWHRYSLHDLFYC